MIWNHEPSSLSACDGAFPHQAPLPRRVSNTDWPYHNPFCTLLGSSSSSSSSSCNSSSSSSSSSSSGRLTGISILWGSGRERANTPCLSAHPCLSTRAPLNCCCVILCSFYGSCAESLRTSQETNDLEMQIKISPVGSILIFISKSRVSSARTGEPH